MHVTTDVYRWLYLIDAISEPNLSNVASRLVIKVQDTIRRSVRYQHIDIVWNLSPLLLTFIRFWQRERSTARNSAPRSAVKHDSVDRDRTINKQVGEPKVTGNEGSIALKEGIVIARHKNLVPMRKGPDPLEECRDFAGVRFTHGEVARVNKNVAAWHLQGAEVAVGIADRNDSEVR